VSLAARIAFDAGDERAAPVRVGVTVGKHMARKSVQRNLVKRILREAARWTLPGLKEATGARRVDLVLRLKTVFPQPQEMPLTVFRRVLRSDADLVLQRLLAHLVRPAQP